MRLIEWQKINADGKETARVKCPQCQQWATLDHDIAANGAVYPSLICPTNGCGFHDVVMLAGWQRKEIRSVDSESSGE
jgi:hypothetical protein